MSKRNVKSQDLPATTGFDINDEMPIWRSSKLECPIELLGGELYDFLKNRDGLTDYAKLNSIYAETTNYHHIWYSCCQEILCKNLMDVNPCRFHFYKVDDDNVILEMHPDLNDRDFYNRCQQSKARKYEQLQVLFDDAIDHIESYVSARKRRLQSRVSSPSPRPRTEPDFVLLLIIMVAIIFAAFIFN